MSKQAVVSEKRNKARKGGRPPVPVDEALSVKFGIAMPQSLREELDSIAESDGVTVNEIIRDLLQDGLAGNATRQRGLLLRAVAVTATKFKVALDSGALKGTDSHDQAEEVLKFFAQLAEDLRSVPPDGDEVEEVEED